MQHWWMRWRTAFLLVFLAFAAPAATQAQPFTRNVEPFPVRANGQQIALPFAGGTDTPQHRFADLDSDGDLDLVVFDGDRAAEYYKNEGTRFAPNFKLRPESSFLPDFSIWFLLVDFDGDGKVDVCTDDSAFTGIRVYRNTGTTTSPAFTLFLSPVLDTTGAAVYAGGNSIPSFVDIDGDGDLDIISPSVSGSANFYRNVGTRSQPRYAYVQGNWQNILIIGDTCTTSPVALQNPNHGSAAYSFADIDADGDLDMFVGDYFWNGLFFIHNAGTPQNAVMQCGTGYYPPSDPINTIGFNQTSLVDIDGDNDLDLFVGVLGGIVQTEGFLHFRNDGSSQQQNLRRVTNNFISSIDVGKAARPAFVDIDGDSDLDMFVGSLNGQLTFFRNTGTRTSPEFTLADSVYQGISADYYFTPAFVDIDRDGDYDLFAGLYNGRIRFYRNTGTRQAAQFVQQPFGTDTIDVINNAVPAFVDIDNDGDLDLFIGKRNGSITLYRNDGTTTTFAPVLVTRTWLGISTGFDGLITPTFADTDGDGDADLLFGAADGRVEQWENTGPAGNPQFVRRTDRFANAARTQESFPALADIEGDGDLDLVVGTSKGGLHYYRNGRLGTSVPDSPLPSDTRLEQNYPNPFNPATTIRFQVGEVSRQTRASPEAGGQESEVSHVTLKVYDVLGREVATLVDEVMQPGSYERVFNAEGLASGVYLYRLSAVPVGRRDLVQKDGQAGGFVETKRFVVLR